MHTKSLLATSLVALAFAAVSGCTSKGDTASKSEAASPASAQAMQPNIIIIFTDDQGYQDVGCFGSPLIKTPELDRMAKEGRRFTSFYVAAAVCSPSRGALLTGRYPRRIGIKGVYFPRSENGMHTSEITLADVLKKEGYATGCVGKWHLGHRPEYLPTSRGFDFYFGVPYSNDKWLDPVNTPPADDIVLNEGRTLEDYRAADGKRAGGNKNKVPLMRGNKCIEWPADQSLLTRRYTTEAVKFIDANNDHPFFLYVAHTMPHIPLFASEKFKGKSERGLYGDVIEEIDWSVGQILGAVRRNGLSKNTIVVFTSDNGPWLRFGKDGGSALPLRDGKGSTYEGGQRVPCIMWWPGQIPADTECKEMATAMDMMPTLSKLAGSAAPADRKIDGHNIWPLMSGEEGAQTPYNAFFFGTSAVRVENWKYRKGPEHGRWAGKKGVARSKKIVEQLFNLETDVGEKENLIAQNPEKAKQFKAMLEAFKIELEEKQDAPR